MKNFFLFVVLLISAGCSGGGSGGLFKNWSHAGLDFDASTRTFRGILKTTSVQMPVSGAANFTGEYRGTSGSSSGQGNATLDVSFGSYPGGSADLTLTGWVDASGTGTINGTGFVGGSPGLTFLGEFYGSNASVAAGEFTSGGIVGHFIVSE